MHTLEPEQGHPWLENAWDCWTVFERRLLRERWEELRRLRALSALPEAAEVERPRPPTVEPIPSGSAPSSLSATQHSWFLVRTFVHPEDRPETSPRSPPLRDVTTAEFVPGPARQFAEPAVT